MFFTCLQIRYTFFFVVYFKFVSFELRTFFCCFLNKFRDQPVVYLRCCQAHRVGSGQERELEREEEGTVVKGKV